MTFSLKDLFRRKTRQKSHPIELRPAIDPTNVGLQQPTVDGVFSTSFVLTYAGDLTAACISMTTYPGEFTLEAIDDLDRVEKQYGHGSAEADSVREYWLGKCKVPTYSKDAPAFPEIPYPEDLKDKI